MPSYDLLIPFALTTLVFAIMPGPAVLFSAAQTLARGRSAGLLAVLGLSLGGFVHVAAAAAGLSAIFVYMPTLYVVVKIAGALYLVWLGIQLFRTKSDMDHIPAAQAGARRSAFVEGVVVELLNPKTAIFFIALLPQFADPAASLPIGTQLLLLGTIVNVSFGLVDVATVFLVSVLAKRIAKSRPAQRVMRYVGGSVLIGLGAHLAVSRS